MSDHSQPNPPAHRPAAILAQPIVLLALAAAIGVLTANLWLLARLAEQQASASREHCFWVLCQPGYSLAERAGAFHQLVTEANKEWRSAQLSELNLEGTSLPGAGLEGAGFQRANFSRANLARAKISRASLELADLSGSDLSEADL